MKRAWRTINRATFYSMILKLEKSTNEALVRFLTGKKACRRLKYSQVTSLLRECQRFKQQGRVLYWKEHLLGKYFESNGYTDDILHCIQWENPDAYLHVIKGIVIFKRPPVSLLLDILKQNRARFDREGVSALISFLLNVYESKEVIRLMHSLSIELSLLSEAVKTQIVLTGASYEFSKQLCASSSFNLPLSKKIKEYINIIDFLKERKHVHKYIIEDIWQTMMIT